MFDDLVGVNDLDGREQPGPALALRAKMGPSELAMHYRMGMSDAGGARFIVFSEVDDETGAETLENADIWKTRMQWTRLPTLAEADAFQANARAALLSEWWDRLAAAKREDDEWKPGDDRPMARYAGLPSEYEPSKSEQAAVRAARSDPISRP